MELKSKYFSGPDLETAREAAEGYFGTDAKSLTIETIIAGDENKPWLILAMAGSSKNRRNGHFSLYYEEEGVFLELYPPFGSGTAQDSDEVSKYIQRKSLKQVNPLEALTLLKKGWGRTKIAPPQEETLLNEDITVSFSSDELEAKMVMLPPEEGGEILTEERLREKLEAAGIKHGIIEDAINLALEERNYKKTYLVASGTSPVHGIDTQFRFHFRVERRKGPQSTARNKVDFKSLDLFEHVEAGQLLITRIPPIPGEPGISVKGREIAPKPGKDIRMPPCKNATVNDEGTEMHSNISGMVEFDAGKVIVSDLFVVKGDCDLSVGNIDFDGNVKIKGAVITGLEIRASGHISIDGVVEGSQIIAGGDVELKHGMQGNDKGMISAGGSVTAQFIERSEVISGLDINADVIVHSNIDAGRSLIMKGKRSSIVGGEIRASEEIVAKTLGSVSHAQVDVEVGFHPKKRARLKELRETVAKLNEELKKAEQIMTYIARQNASQENLDKLRETVLENKQQLSTDLKELTDEQSVLENELLESIHGRIHILSTVYPGVKITIGTGFYKVEEEIKYATFKNKDGNVIFTSCEVSGR